MKPREAYARFGNRPKTTLAAQIPVIPPNGPCFGVKCHCSQLVWPIIWLKTQRVLPNSRALPSLWPMIQVLCPHIQGYAQGMARLTHVRPHKSHENPKYPKDLPHFTVVFSQIAYKTHRFLTKPFENGRKPLNYPENH